MMNTVRFVIAAVLANVCNPGLTVGHAPDDWVEGTQGIDDGATRDYYNRAALLPWANFMGDWADADDVSQGDVPFASLSMVDDDQDEYVEWDVTELVGSWIDRSHANQGMLLRNTSSGATHRFYSREHTNPLERPELVIVTSKSTVTLAPQADTYLHQSTYRSHGDLTQLDVSGNSARALLRFDLGAFSADEELRSATLRLFVYGEFGNGDIGVFRSSQSHREPASSPAYGISAEYVEDEGIATDPRVMLFADFESAAWGDEWSYGANSNSLQRVTQDSANLFQSFRGSALRATVPSGGSTGLNMGFRFEDELGSEPEEIYFRYYLRFGESWGPLVGGKLPGPAGRYPGTALEAGWGGRRSNGSNGWSARGLYRVTPPGGNVFERHVPMGNYVYHADMASSFGDNHLWQNDYRGLLRQNRWYAVETFLKLNKPGQNDGILRGWIDGRLAWEKADWRWRDTDILKIQEIWMNIFHGGTTSADQDMAAYIDNVVIATEYIGPLYNDLLFSNNFDS